MNEHCGSLRNSSGRFVECVVRFGPGGLKVEIFSDGSTLISHRFVTGTEAVAWADERRNVWTRDDQ